ncbi:MAG TPA: cysteine desulfurase [Alphaproteobacteria bacterium]|nr:cysteine desulfurase [Alphaproteobacteria bacterium]
MPPLKAFDVAAIRADFPILARQVNGKPLVYLDNAASAQKPRAVLEAMREAAETHYANVHRGLHTLANEATEAFEAARESVRMFLNAPSTEQIIFTSGATDAINLVANSLGQSIKPGDEIILTPMEHHSNIVPWHFLRERQGAVLRWAPMDRDGVLDLEGLRRLIGSRTRMIAMTHMSNVLGTVTPAAEVIRLAHAQGVPVLLDGAQAGVHLPVDVQALDADFYVLNGHKLYGPTGIGVLYGRRALLEAMPPYRGGGEMILEVSQDKITYAGLPHRFEAGTPPILEAIGLGAAITYLSGIDRAAALAHEHALLAHAEERAAELNWLTLHGRAGGKGSIMAFSVDGAHPHDIATLLDRYGVAVRAGHHCAQPLMEFLGVPATARASFAMYNTRAEVDALFEALVRARSILM